MQNTFIYAVFYTPKIITNNSQINANKKLKEIETDMWGNKIAADLESGDPGSEYLIIRK